MQYHIALDRTAIRRRSDSFARIPYHDMRGIVFHTRISAPTAGRVYTWRRVLVGRHRLCSLAQAAREDNGSHCLDCLDGCRLMPS